ncbi:glycoside hydrolase family 92 protein [Butyricimonas sp. NSJ-56]|uniref:Glycoside hydrolase family 92 protein n=1 Tax=Butyricimonas hominis TaxID=2763032 RepID=A0ABR7D5G0_9BACT|nr:GH92 family glycosyl hydrolase [Butyricimonas hominis]MBC5622992.1 glycoside hydrolase family 92 protein [Butyricimonas hominis]
MKIINTAYMALLLCVACSGPKDSAVNVVNPFIGTGFHGHTYPGATVPQGMVQLSPDTRRGNWDACSGYHYSDSTLLGFSHTHLSGTGCIDWGDILVYPSSRELSPDGTADWMPPHPFSHEREEAMPGYYRVELPAEGIEAELTVTPYTGVHRYTFERGGEVSIVVDLAHALSDDKIKEARMERTGDNEIRGGRNTSGWVDNQHIYFIARFSRPFHSLRWVKEGKTVDSVDSITGERLQVIATFRLLPKESVEMYVGLSCVSEENARDNLEYDFTGDGFDHFRREAEQRWRQVLSRMQVKGGTSDECANFYTALYHSFLTPNLVSDANGDYRRHDMKTGKVDGRRKQYSTFSLWDTFRAWHPLMTLLDTTLVGDMVNSMLDIYDVTGELPIWSLSSGETNTMIGYHAVSVIADAYLKGIRGFDARQALEAMTRSAEKNAKGAAYYTRYGFIPSDLRRESVSCLLEFAYDDWCISRLATALGESETARRFALRAGNYANVFDGSGRFFRPKRLDGNWEPAFDPCRVGRAYTEANAWQYRFFVPHDVRGMIQLYGGEAMFLADLDSLFHGTSTVESDLPDITGLIGQYAHGNEPSHHMAYLYTYAGQPWKTQEMVRRILKEMYRPTPDGICGNEDCGQMSAWYIMSSLGFYPVCPGSNEFILTSPLFPEATICLANGKRLVITANEPASNTYIRRVCLNGREMKRCFITYEELMQGGELSFELSAEPCTEWGGYGSGQPYSMTRDKQVAIPYVSRDLYLFEDAVVFEIGCTTSGAELHYTLDGSEPTLYSPLYHEAIRLDSSAILRVRGFKEGYLPSRLLELPAVKAVYRPAERPHDLNKGFRYRYYEGKFTGVEDMEKIQPADSGYMPVIRIDQAPREDHYGYIWEGWIRVPSRGVYEFELKSDDGSVLYVGDRKVVDNDGSHAAVSAFGRIALQQGYHPFRLLYFEDYEGQFLEWKWKKVTR